MAITTPSPFAPSLVREALNSCPSTWAESVILGGTPSPGSASLTTVKGHGVLEAETDHLVNRAGTEHRVSPASLATTALLARTDCQARQGKWDRLETRATKGPRESLGLKGQSESLGREVGHSHTALWLQILPDQQDFH